MTDRLKFLRNSEIRAEIVYTVGGDPTRYYNTDKGLNKADMRRIVQALADNESQEASCDMELRELYDRACELAGGEYEPNYGCAWGLKRRNLKDIHQAVDAYRPQEIMS